MWNSAGKARHDRNAACSRAGGAADITGEEMRNTEEKKGVLEEDDPLRGGRWHLGCFSAFFLFFSFPEDRSGGDRELLPCRPPPAAGGQNLAPIAASREER